MFCIIHPRYNRRIEHVDSRTCKRSLELDDFGKELFVESKQHALSLKINLPVIPRVRHAVTDEKNLQSFYTNVFKQVFEKAASSLLRRYQSQPLQMSNLLRSLVEDETMSRVDIKGASVF